MKEGVGSIAAAAALLLARARSRMSLVEHFSELRGLDVGVDSRGLDAVVAEDELDMTDVGAAFEQVGRTRMTQGVRLDAEGDPRDGGVVAKHRSEHASADTAARACDEEGLLAGWWSRKGLDSLK